MQQANQETVVSPSRSSAELLKLIEGDLDAQFHAIDLPHQNLTVATWYLFTVFEDAMRINLRVSPVEDRAAMVMRLDRAKYGARFAFDRIRAECRDKSRAAIPTRVTATLFKQTTAMLFGGIDFMDAHQICSAAHANGLRFSETDLAFEFEIDKLQNDPRYATLEWLGHLPAEVLDHSSLLYLWMHELVPLPPVVQMIAEAVRTTETKIQYSYRPGLAVGLAEQMHQYPFLLPEGWRFAWGGRHETTLLINALLVRCLYHVVAVHFGAVRKRLHGLGAASILLITTKLELVHDLRVMCSLPPERIRAFVDFLTFGSKTRTPDPALQPLIGIGGDLVAIPCLMVLSSNQERNILGLQARTDAKRFDALSGLFEGDMIASLVGRLTRWPMRKTNAKVKLNGRVEEVDLLVADLATRTVLACELKWMLQPGETHEVQQRKRSCVAKVTQLRRKVDWLRGHTAALMRREFQLDGDEAEGWSIHGVVVIQTFGGTPSPDAQIPIMTSHLFAQGMEIADSLAQFASWSQSLTWLPQQGQHFDIRHNRYPMPSLGKDLVGPGFDLLCTRTDYYAHVEQTLRAVALTSD